MSNHNFLGLICLLLVLSCTSSKDNDIRQNSVDHNLRKRPLLLESDSTIDQALDALTEIQRSGNGGMMLYLTFPNISHEECVGEVAHYDLSQEEFKDALLAVMNKNNRHLNNDEKMELAALASLPLKQYKIIVCGAGDNSKKGLAPREGRWIVTAIFGASDLIINWH